jgi:hypothetical protein
MQAGQAEIASLALKQRQLELFCVQGVSNLGCELIIEVEKQFFSKSDLGNK